jgi:hypothetical protein
MKLFQYISLLKRSQRLFYVAAAFLISVNLISCGSDRQIKEYNKQGKLAAIDIIKKNGVKHRILIEYDKNWRVTGVNRYIPPSAKPVISRNIKYYSSGRIRMQQFTELRQGKIEAVRNNWVESFFYDNTNRLVRVETSYKSSYSISKNNTPYMITNVYYKNKRIEKIQIDAGTFRREMNLSYADNNISDIDYRYYLLNRKSKRFEAERNLHISYRKDKPAVIEDMIKKIKITQKKEMYNILKKEKILHTINQLYYSSGSENFLKYLEKIEKN